MKEWEERAAEALTLPLWETEGQPAETTGGRATEETASATEGQETAREENAAAMTEGRELAGLTRIGFAPITRVDAARREVELCATSEAVDSHGTVFDYAASKDAFTRWIGNVREMHERRAVGRRVSVRCDDEARKVFVRVRISRGAEDTWDKVVDGTLRGASIGAANVVWARQRRAVAGQPRWLEVATRYDLAELSLVDNPSNPDALGITFVRDAVPDLALLDTLEEEPTEHDVAASESENEVEAETAETRASEPTSGPTSANVDRAAEMEAPARSAELQTSALGPIEGPAAHAREPFHAAAQAILLGCGCLECVVARAALGGEEPTAMTADGAAEGTANRAGEATETGLREAALTRAMAAGLSASAARLAAVDVELRELRRIVETLASSLVATVMNSVAGSVVDSVAERVERALGGVRVRLETLEAQPLPGGPVALPMAPPAARPVEKAHALMPGASASAVDRAEQLRALESLAGRLTDPQAQIAVAAEMIRLRDSA